MLNLELARIVVAERIRTTDEHIRQDRFRQDLAERRAAAAEQDRTGTRPAADPCGETSQRAKPALG
ncbi:MAG TPA: hypothetical protein VKR24_01460 [Candidatus Limnocylindrales bacterium]|nr:hypothetical protein [Candidatus Limnocylindrales bacterium]